MQWIKSRLSLSEISGAFGDLGTLIPITIDMTKKGVLQPCVSFFWGGIMNIVAGLYWDMPMPVQPMKTIATVVSSKVITTPGGVAAAGLLTGGCAFVLGMFDVISTINRYVPKSCIAIVQCVTGIGLAQNGFKLIDGLNTWSGADSYTTAMLCSILIVLNFVNTPWHSVNKWLQRIPSALLLFIIGLMISVSVSTFSWTFVNPFIPVMITAQDWKIGFIDGAAVQIPLTLLNSVIAICDLSNSLFSDEIQAGIKKEMTTKSTTVSLGLVNVACVFGGIPTCHGSGGMAGQYKFGGRSGLSVVFLGIVKLMIGLLGASVFNTLALNFPNSVLGLLLFVCGAELTKYGFKYVNSEGFIVAAGVAIGLASKIWIGFIAGIVLHYINFDIPQESKPRVQNYELQPLHSGSEQLATVPESTRF